jgi:hypothetical protein
MDQIRIALDKPHIWLSITPPSLEAEISGPLNDVSHHL